jgi:predicted O-methyltransferase YrrM
MYTKELQTYIEEHTTPENALLHALNRSTHLKTLYPRMLSGHILGRFLALISKIIRPKRILEIGTFTGYSALCLAEGLHPDGQLHTIEINEELEEANLDVFRAAGYGSAIVQHIGDALEVIPKLGMQFDLVFLDANKESYPEYFDVLLQYMNTGSILIADNVLWSGKVTDNSTKKRDRDTEGIVRFNSKVQCDTRVENVLLPVRDGIMMIRKV